MNGPSFTRYTDSGVEHHTAQTQDSTKRLRSACDACHQAKVRCTGGGSTSCTRCVKDKTVCRYSYTATLGKPRGRRNNKTLERLNQLPNQDPSDQRSTTPSNCLERRASSPTDSVEALSNGSDLALNHKTIEQDLFFEYDLDRATITEPAASSTYDTSPGNLDSEIQSDQFGFGVNWGPELHVNLSSNSLPLVSGASLESLGANPRLLQTSHKNTVNIHKKGPPVEYKQPNEQQGGDKNNLDESDEEQDWNKLMGINTHMAVSQLAAPLTPTSMQSRLNARQRSLESEPAVGSRKRSKLGETKPSILGPHSSCNCMQTQSDLLCRLRLMEQKQQLQQAGAIIFHTRCTLERIEQLLQCSECRYDKQGPQLTLMIMQTLLGWVDALFASEDHGPVLSLDVTVDQYAVSKEEIKMVRRLLLSRLLDRSRGVLCTLKMNFGQRPAVLSDLDANYFQKSLRALASSLVQKTEKLDRPDESEV